MTYSLDFRGHLPSFRDWLFTRPGDLTTGRLFPYLRSKPVYLCPTDQLALASRRRGPPLPTDGLQVIGRRDYSYPMNCGICHATDLAKFLEPTRTMLHMEANLATNDYSGQVGPAFNVRSLSFRHANRGQALFGDLHIERRQSGPTTAWPGRSDSGFRPTTRAVRAACRWGMGWCRDGLEGPAAAELRRCPSRKRRPQW